MTEFTRALPTIRYRYVLAVLALIACSLVILYLPGLSGPYTLDDNSNLLTNKHVQITELSVESLRNAAFSVRSGPTYRPVSIASFAINYYFAGSFNDSTPYKITNLIIHIVNGGLAFWFLYLLTSQLYARTGATETATRVNRSALLFSATVALLWAIHPIQLTSVLYLIQRMSALAGTFVLLALIAYLVGRNRINAGKKSGFALVFIVTPLFTLIGTFAKENAALLPLYIVAIETTIYRHSQPWANWNKLQKKTRLLIFYASGLLVAATMLWLIVYSLPGYNTRPFSMGERILTESRVIAFYISLILVPRINSFGLHHDDILISHNILSPWTTLPSLLFLASLLFFAFYCRKKYPLISVGIFIFFAAHALESTIYPLDIAYEHRNYFASLGLLIAAAEVIRLAGLKFNRKIVFTAVLCFILLTAATTYIRATQWRSDKSLYAFEALHHPNSAIMNFELAGFLESYGKHDQAIAAARKSISLNPDRVSFRLLLALLLSRNNHSIDKGNSESIVQLMHTGVITPTTYLLLHKVMRCLNTECRSLLPELEKWLTVLVNQKNFVRRPHEYNHMLGAVKFSLGKTKEAEAYLLEAVRINPGYSTAYIDLASVYLVLRKSNKAINIYKKLLKIDPDNSAEYSRLISSLSEQL